MREGHINLYSDTQSRPSSGMRQAMLAAPVGDEQKDLDPSVNALCAHVAGLLGMETAVFLPSGTMCNEIAMMVHCQPGDEIYADRTAHILNFEAGGPAAFAGANIFTLDGKNGIYTAEQLAQATRHPMDRYAPRSRMISVEQTANLGGGKVWPLDAIRAVRDAAKERNLKCHMDGARLMNAVVASGVPAKEFTEGFDSAWVDLSKGLGCPFGGVLAGSRDFIYEAWRCKQRIGGAMRQAGMMAAAGLYAFEHNVDRLAQDHANAKRLAEIVNSHPLIEINPDDVETNLLFIDIEKTAVSPYKIVSELEALGINIGAFGTTLRAVTYLNIDSAQIEEAGEQILKVINALMDEQGA
ncbi:MAG: threonine aldolase family protein [Chloroflexota bacterium]